MASNTLSGAGVSPANTKSQLLHIGTGTATDATVRTGDGTETALKLVPGGAEIVGKLTAIGVPVFGLLGADVSAPTTTVVDISAFDVVPVAGGTYLIELLLIAQSAATGTGVQIVASGGSGTLTMVDPASQFGISSITGTYAATSAPVANANFGILLVGTFSPTNTTPLKFSVKSEVASSAVTIKAGSVRRITRMS